MPPEASEGVEGKEVEMVPAAPDPEQQLERDSEEEKETAANIMKLLSKLQQLRARISQLLGPAGPRRLVTGDRGRRCLVFMETELSIIVAFLRSLSPQHLDGETLSWLPTSLCWDVPPLADQVLREVDPSRHTLLGRATQCFHRSKSYLFLHRTVQLYCISEDLSRYTIRHLLLTSSDIGLTPQRAEAGALPLVGIDRPAKKIFRWLTRQGTMDRSHVRVMSIVGPVGTGKTTLAVELRNRLRQHETRGGLCYFQCNVMAQGSWGTDRNIRLLQDILSQVSPPATALSSDLSQANTMEVLVRLVSECLRDKRYFIIIDYIHRASDWEKIKGAFPADSNNLGSRILITTRVTSIAEACCSSYSYDGLVHEMKPLNEIDSERLLLARAVGSEDSCLPYKMKLFCDEILRTCDGIPLFITCMADWLKEQRSQKQHQREEEDDDQEHQRFAIMHCKEQVPWLPEQALSSAFNNDFPNDDMRILLFYMSMFHFGYKFEKDRLILKWMHEGLIDWNVFYSSGGELQLAKDKEKAEWSFSQLVDRNVITCVASNCKHKQDEAETCQWQVNHFIQQFLASKSAEMGFIFTTTTLNLLAAADQADETSSRMPRRLALHHPDPQLPSLLQTMDLSCTRSLSVSGAVNRIIPLYRFVNLVVLDFEGWENLEDEDLLQVCTCKMIFLTYLSVRKTPVSNVPRQIKELWSLETLDVSYTQIRELPLEVFELGHLEHLDLRGTQITHLPKQIVGQENEFPNLPIGGEGSINSVETATRVPHDVRRLYNQGTLATVDLTEHPASFVRSLGDLRYIWVLAVTWSFHQSTDRDYCEAFLSSIQKWEFLDSLTIHCGLGCSMEFLGSLEKSRAPQGLEKFKVIAGRFASVPQWIQWNKHLAFVQITVCNKQTTTDDLKILGALPKLQCLILGLDFIPGQPIVIGNERFRELRRFSLHCPMPWLTFETGAMPKLTYLQLKFCSSPASQICVPSGISNLHRLTEVALCYNAQYLNSPSIKMTVEAVTKQVAKHRNPIDLLINGIEQDDVQEADEVTENKTGTSNRTNDGAEDDAKAVGEVDHIIGSILTWLKAFRPNAILQSDVSEI